MSDNEPTTRVLNYRYGTPYWYDFPPEIMIQLRLAHDLTNKLTEVELHHDEARENVFNSFEDISEQNKAIDSVLAELEHSPNITDKRKTELRKQLREHRANIKELKKLHKDDAKEGLTAAREVRDSYFRKGADSENSLYADFVQTRGLNHGTFNRIVRNNHTARLKNILSARKEGRRASWNFRAWETRKRHGITLSVQNQVGKDNSFDILPGRLASEWTGKKRRRNEKLTNKRRTLRLRLGRARGFDPIILEMPFVYDREIPPDAEVTWVHITRQMIADRPRIFINFSITLPKTPEKESGNKTEVNLRMMTGIDDRFLIADVRSSDTIPPPPEKIEDLVTIDDNISLVYTHPRWNLPFRRHSNIRSVRDEALNWLRPVIINSLENDPSLANKLDIERPKTLKRAGFSRFHQIANSWPKGHPSYKVIKQWLERDIHLWRFAANEYDQVIAWRRYSYRIIAKWLASFSKEITIYEEMDFTELKKRPKEGEPDPHEELRHHLHNVSPGELRSYIEFAGNRDGVIVTTKSG